MGLFDHFDFDSGLIAAWRDSAACKGRTDVFYPPPFKKLPEDPREQDQRIEQCRTICRQCPVFDDCQQWAIENPNEGIDMVLAGMTYEERGSIRG